MSAGCKTGLGYGHRSNQDRRQIDIYRRTGGDWAHERVQGGTFRIETLDLEVPVEAVYEDIDPELPAA